ncbi:hypothetical protein HID58_046854, partial [Brassica napus]
VIQLTKRDDSVYPRTDHPFRKKCRYEVISTKIKKSLLKAEIITWASLEHGKQPAVSMRPAYRSSKKVKDYDKLEDEKDDKLEGDTTLNKFFREIYLNSDEDMRNYNVFGILIDSFVVLHNQQVESNGTVFSIDWKDVGAKKIECTLHDDLALKT